MSSDGGGLREWLDQFNAAIARRKRARRNEERWIPPLSERLRQALQLRQDLCTTSGRLPKDGSEATHAIHATRQQRLIERIRQSRVDAESAIRQACDELRPLLVRFSPNGQEEAALRTFEGFSGHPFASREEIVAMVEKMLTFQPTAIAPVSTPLEPSVGLPPQGEEASAADGDRRALPTGEHPVQSTGPPLEESSGDRTAPANRRHRGPDLEKSRERIELVSRLRGELTRIIRQTNVAAFTGPADLKQSYPDFALWKLVSPEQFWSDLCSEEFRFRRYADALVCQQYQLIDVSSLNKDRAKLRRARQSNLGR